MCVSHALEELAELFTVPLYVVGGAVRDMILDRTPADFDITAPLPPLEVEELLRGTEFSAYSESPRLGTLLIRRGEEKFEYTAFRKDSYDGSGSHVPTEVKFTRDIKEDARRRDFTVNAVYFDIRARAFVDPLACGIEDVKKGILKTTGAPEDVFSEDGLRILRMVRIAAECGFEVEEKTFKVARELARLLEKISDSRKGDELAKMLVADRKYGIKNAQVRAIELLIQCGAADYVAFELAKHISNALSRGLKTLELVPPELRLAAILCESARPTQGGKLQAEADLHNAAKRLEELGFGKDEVKRISLLASVQAFDTNCDTPEVELRRFIQKYHDTIPDLIVLKNVEYVAGGGRDGESPSAIRLTKLYQKMLGEGVPFAVKELKVRGEDLIALNIPKDKRGELMKTLLVACAEGGKMLERANQLAFIKKAQRKYSE